MRTFPENFLCVRSYLQHSTCCTSLHLPTSHGNRHDHPPPTLQIRKLRFGKASYNHTASQRGYRATIWPHSPRSEPLSSRLGMKREDSQGGQTHFKMYFSQALEIDSLHKHLGDLGEISCIHQETGVVQLSLTPSPLLCGPWKEGKNLCNMTASFCL